MTKNQQKKYARARQELEKYFGEKLEVVDAKKPLTLLPNEVDFSGGIKFDPGRCGFARTCIRLMDAHRCLFFENTVYIDHRGEDGVRRIYRYVPSAATARTLKAFDQGELKLHDVLRAFVLNPPPISRTLIQQRRQRRAWRRTKSGRAIENLRHAVLREKGIRRDIENQQERRVRLEKQYSPEAPSVIETKTQLKKLRERLSNAVEDRRNKETIAKDVRNHAVGQGTAQPKRHIVNARRGIFFWNTDQAVAR